MIEILFFDQRVSIFELLERANRLVGLVILLNCVFLDLQRTLQIFTTVAVVDSRQSGACKATGDCPLSKLDYDPKRMALMLQSGEVLGCGVISN